MLAVCRAQKVSDNHASLQIDWDGLAEEQQKDKVTPQIDCDPSKIHYTIENGYLFHSVPSQQQGQKWQLVIPVCFREELLKFAHDSPLSGHFGQLKTLLQLLEVAYWPSIWKDVWKYCRDCQVYQQYKPSITKLSGQLQSTPVVEPGHMLCVGLMGPFPRNTKQHEYLLVVVDYCSKWVEMFPMRTAKAHKVARVLVEEIFTHWGTPAYLVSDRGAQFTSRLLTLVCQQWGVVQKLTTAYHPQTSLTERINCTLKMMTESYVKDHHRHWDRWLPEFRFAINSAWQESTGFTPAEIALGCPLKGPLERAVPTPPRPDSPTYELLERQQELVETVKENVEKAQLKQKRNYNRKRTVEDFQEGDLVSVRAHPVSKAQEGHMAKLAARWKGPAKVCKRLGPVNYLISFLDALLVVDTFHVQNVKPFYGPGLRNTVTWMKIFILSSRGQQREKRF
uniref:Gypsy retrotransposon integrase-like protein 1 n=1 Tax=Sinocyclocheilus anshuiensis TaxID=1608454 RepID=A0A671M2X0_9TELE